MPSLSHEALLLLFRSRPDLVPSLLRNALSVDLPAYTEVRVESSDLIQAAPAEYHADLVVLLIEDRPVLGVVLEVQLSRKERKRFTWPMYVAGIRARLESNACLLVVTPSAEVARWAAEPIQLRALLYSDWIRSALSEAARTALEELMDLGNYEFQSEFARKYVAQGRAGGKAEAILTILEERRIPIQAEQRERILGTAELEVLNAWVRRAVTVSSTDELFR